MLNRNLEIFRVAAKVRNFTETAGALGMTQPNVTQQLASLEKELKVKLFNRQGRNVTLTPAGTVLQKECERLFAIVHETVRKVQNAAVKRKHFKCAGTFTAGSYLLVGLIASFQKENPNLSLALKIDTAQNIEDALTAHKLDLALVDHPFDRNIFLSIPYCKDRIVPVFPPNYQKQTFSLKDYILKGGKLVLRDNTSGTRFYFEKFLKEHDIPEPPLHHVQEVNNVAAIKELVKAGAGITVLSDLAIEDECKAGTLQQGQFHEGTISREVSFIYLPGTDESFIDAFMTFSQEHKGWSLN